MITLLTAVNCTSTAILSNWGIDYFGVTREQFLVSQTVMMLTIAFTPILLAPVSEAVSVVDFVTLLLKAADVARWDETLFIMSHRSCEYALW
jgi:hypothetical protein